MNKITLVVPRGTEVEVVEDNFMPPNFRVLVEANGWHCINRQRHIFLKNAEVVEVYRNAMYKFDLWSHGDDGWFEKRKRE